MYVLQPPYSLTYVSSLRWRCSSKLNGWVIQGCKIMHIYRSFAMWVIVCWSVSAPGWVHGMYWGALKKWESRSVCYQFCSSRAYGREYHQGLCC